MKQKPMNRRNFNLALSGALATTASVIATSGPAEAYQGNMERALAQLQNALGSLHRATSDKGGHKANAARLIQEAMGEVQAGINFAARRFGD